MEQMIGVISSVISLVVSGLAFILSGVAFWHSSLRRGTPKFVCSRWTAIQMQQSSGEPRAAFSIHVTVVNQGTAPLEIRDLLLVAETGSEQPIIYEPILLWDLRQWIEDGNRPDKVGRAQKGQVPLPLQLNAGQYFDFEYSVLFLPLDKAIMVDPHKHTSVELKLYAYTDRNHDYVVIGEQAMGEEVKTLASSAFAGAVSTISKSKRSLLIGRVNSGVLAKR